MANQEPTENEKAFIKEMESIVKEKLQKYGLKNAIIFIPNKGRTIIRANKPLEEIPRV